MEGFTAQFVVKGSGKRMTGFGFWFLGSGERVNTRGGYMGKSV
jgi:hypothetical protein